MNKIVNFEVDNFSVVQKLSDEQFATVEVYVCHDGNNRHNMPIPLATIKKAAKTLKNKYLVAGFDGNDFEGHEPDEQIIGHFPESGKISYRKKEGRTYLVAEAVMSKVYADWAYEQFVDKNHRGVSMEISVTEFEELDEGLTGIKEFVFNGVTVLGDTHTPACEGADASIIKFNVENASEYYSKYSWKSNTIVRDDISFDRDETGKEGTDSMKETENLVVDENITNTPEVVAETEVVAEETITDTVEVPAEEVFEEDKKEEEAKTEEEDVTMEEDDKEDEDKEDEDKKDEDDSDEDAEEDEEDFAKEAKPEEEKKSEEKFESLTVDQMFQVLQAACRESDLGWVESFDDTYVYCYNYDKGYTYRYTYTLNGTAVNLGLEKERVMRGGYVPFEAETDEGETVATETVAETVVAEDVANPEVETLKEEIAELKATIDTYEAAKKESEVESILSGVVDTLTPEQVNELREEAANFAIEDLNEFSNKVKAIAFESVKQSEGRYSFTRIALGDVQGEATTGKYSW